MNREDRRRKEIVQVQGYLVEKDALRIAERVNEYDPNLRVQYLEQAASLGEPPFRIVERCKDGQDRLVFGVWELNEQVLHRLYMGDSFRNDIDERITKQNEKARRELERKNREVAEEANDVVFHVLRSPKTTYTYKNSYGRKIKFQ